jgi:hypothetical protein
MPATPRLGPATNQTGLLSPADTYIFVLHITDDATLGDSSKPPRLSVLAIPIRN